VRALGKALQAHEAAYLTAVMAVRLIAMTERRREEACALRWEEINKVSSCLRLTTTKTGRSTRPVGS
jgi:integrase